MLTDLMDFYRLVELKSVKICTICEPLQIKAHRFKGLK